MSNYYITTPIYYVNDIPHIGHAYTTLACDVMARFRRLIGDQVKFLTGTDEHGQKVEKSAAAAGYSPKDFVDMNAARFRELADAMNYSYDDFIRTTEPRHITAAQAMWQKLLASGDIYLEKYAGWYSVRDEAFYAESELVDGKAPTGAPVEWVEEPSYFFRLSKFQDALLKHYEENPDFIYPESRRNEVVSFVKGGLVDLSVSRTSFKWGVPVPGDEAHVMYVWLDALTNYVTALGFPQQSSEMSNFWPEAIHVVGKDILRFHAVYWPAFLMSAGLPLPKKIVAHGWWTNEGQKISKSLGNVIDPHQLVAEFGLEQTRYFLLREVPFGNDGNFARDSMINRVNAELANNIGNLTQRVLSMIAKNMDGISGTLSADNADDAQLLKKCREAYSSYVRRMDAFQFHLALEEIVQLGNAANEYIDKMAPWTLKKIDEARMREVLSTLLEPIRYIGFMLMPVMPESAHKVLSLLGEEGASFSSLENSKPIEAGRVLPAPSPIFPRIEG